MTAWRYWGWLPANDRDFTGLPVTTISQNPSTQRQWSQEIRYAGSSGRLDYVAGLFGFHQTIATTGLQEQGSLASLWLLSGANANNPRHPQWTDLLQQHRVEEHQRRVVRPAHLARDR